MSVSGLFFSLMTIICWGLASFVDKMALRTLSPAMGVMLRTMIVAICVLPWFAWKIKTGEVAQVSGKALVLLAASGILATLLGQFSFYAALKYNEVSRVVPLCSTYPIVAALLGLAFMGESLSAQKLVGIAMVVGGVMMLK